MIRKVLGAAIVLAIVACSPSEDKAGEAPAAPPVTGTPTGSGGNPSASFDGDVGTFWISPETGSAVRNAAWIGYRFDTPQVVRTVVLTQSNNPPYRQDSVMVQSSVDGGQTWTDVVAAQTPMGAPPEIQIPANATAAADWRILATAANSTAPAHAWTPMEVQFRTN